MDVIKSVSVNVPVHFFTIHKLVLQNFTGKYIVNYPHTMFRKNLFLGKIQETQAILQHYKVLCSFSVFINVIQISLL